jgi:hypothetical protein
MIRYESEESSSPIVTRAVAAGLRGEYIQNYQLPAWQKMLLLGLGNLPQGMARFVISRFQSLSGLPPRVLDSFSVDQLVSERLKDYAHLTGKYPAITLGAALGGASTSLALSLGSPFLPQTFVTTLKGGSPNGDARIYLERSREAALRIADQNPRLLTIQHYDPVHDGWLTRWVNHLRFKLLELPAAYVEFIRARLEPGGALVFLEGGAKWLHYRLGARSLFQVGGWGGIPAREFLEGSPRLSEYARRTGLRYASWALDEYPLEEGPESEWGSESELAETLERFCAREGYRFVRIRLDHPNDFSHLAFAAARLCIEKEGRTPLGVVVEMFSQFDSTAARRGELLPLWLVFNTVDSLEYLKAMLARFPSQAVVFFSPLATFSITPDLVPWRDWQAALAGFDWINIGTRASHYPSDAAAIVRWPEKLRQWVERNPHPVKVILDADELASLAARIKKL